MSKNQAKILAEQIRDEYRIGSNSAERVGNALLAIINSFLNIEELSGYFLRKDKADITQFVIQFLDGLKIGEKASVDKDGNAILKNIKAESLDFLHGIVGEYISSPKFTSGFLGEGFRINQKSNGDWNLEIDNLTVRKVFQVFELLIQEVKHQGGVVVHSPAGGKITKVTDGGSYWRCEIESADTFFKDDLVLCQQFTGKIKRYWRAVTSAGDGYINLSKTDCEANSAIPEVEDEIATLGNKTNTARQSAYLISVVGEDAPYTAYYSGINSYSLKGKEHTRIGNLEGVVSPVFGPLKGSGALLENAYVQGMIRLQNGKTVENVIDETSDKLSGDINNINTSVSSVKNELGATITNVENNFNTSLNSTKNELNSSISKVQGDADTAKGLAQTAQDAVDGLEIGVSNLMAISRLESGTINSTHGSESDWASEARKRSRDFIKTQGFTFISGWTRNNRFGIFYLFYDSNKAFIKGSFYDSGLTGASHLVRVPRNANSFRYVIYSDVSDNFTISDLRNEKIKIEFGNKPTDWSPASEDTEAQINSVQKEIKDVEQRFEIANGAINSHIKETTQLVNEAKLANGESIKTLEQVKVQINDINVTAGQINTTLGEVTKKQGEINSSISNLEQTAGSISASIDGFKETEAEIKATASKIEATHAGIVLEASEKSAQKAIDGLEIGVRNLALQTKIPVFAISDGRINQIEPAYKMSEFFKSNYVDILMDKDVAVSFRWHIDFEEDEKPEGKLIIQTSSGRTWLTSPAIEVDSNSGFYSGFRAWGKTENEVFNGINFRLDNIPKGKKVTITDFIITSGNKPTDWTPAPEDIEDKIETTRTEFDSKLEITKEAITATSTKVDGLTGRVQETEAKLEPDRLWVAVKDNSQKLIDDLDLVNRNYAYVIKEPDDTAIYVSNDFPRNKKQYLSLSLWGNFEEFTNADPFSEILFGGNSDSPFLDYKYTRKSVNHIVYEGGYVDLSLETDKDLTLSMWGPEELITKAKIDLGTKATDWTPAPEELLTPEDIRASIELTTNGLNVFGEHHSFTGKVTFASLASDAQGKINSAQSTANTALTNANSAGSNLTALQSRLGELAYEDMVERAKLGSTIIEGGFIKTSLIKAKSITAEKIDVDNLIGKKLLTEVNGPRIEAIGSELKVYGYSEHPNIIFGIDKDGYSVLKYLNNDGEEMYNLGPNGIVWGLIKPSSFTKVRFYKLSAYKYKKSLTYFDVSAIKDAIDNWATDFYRYFAGSNPTIKPEDREPEKYIYKVPTLTSIRIDDGIYCTPPISTDKNSQYPSGTTQELFQPGGSSSLYQFTTGVYNKAPIYVAVIYAYRGGMLAYSQKVYWNGGMPDPIQP